MAVICCGWVKDRRTVQSLITEDLKGCQGLPTLAVVGRNKMKTYPILL